MDSIMHAIIKKSLEEKTLISIKTDREDIDRFSAGYISKYNDKFILIDAVDENGNSDGIVFMHFDDIYCIETNDEYLKALNKLQVADEKSGQHKYDISSLSKLLKSIRKTKDIVSINTYMGAGYLGAVNDFDNAYVLIDNIDATGKYNGSSCLLISDIEKIYINDSEIKRISKLLG